MAKFTSAEITPVVETMIKLSHAKHGNHSFAAGYLGSMLSQVLVDLPKHKQAEILQRLQVTAFECMPEVAI